MTIRLRFILAALFLSLAGASAIADSDRQMTEETRDIWQLALASAEGSLDWIPGQTLMTMEFLDRKGQTDQVLRTSSATRLTSEGPVTESIILEEPGGLIGTFMPDGAMDPDAVSGASGDDDAGDGEADNAPSFINPFLPEVQETLWIQPTGEEMVVGDVSCNAYEIEWQDPDTTTYSGTIWLSDSGSRPMLLQVSGKSAMDGVRELEVEVAYRPEGSPTLPATVVTAMEFRFALVIRARIRMTLDFSDYLRPDPPL